MYPKPQRYVRSIVALLFVISFPLASRGQVVSPSPVSSSLAKFGDHPVDLSTGVPGISVPLYVIPSLSLSYPISISYHAAGAKVAESAGPVGLGWSLDAGGQVTRVMRVRPDEKPNGFFSFAAAVPNATDAIPLATKQAIDNRSYDMMPDLFYFNTGTLAGKLIFDNQIVPHTLPQSTIKISTDNSLSYFSFTDPNGTTYSFEPGETATTSIAPEYTSCWYLTRIVSADKQDTIRFNYVLRGTQYSYRTNEGEVLNYYFNAPSGSSGFQTPVNDNPTGLDVVVKGSRYLASIESKRAKVQFTMGTRTDITGGEKKLDNIIIFLKDPRTGALVEEKRINFTYGYFQNIDSGTRLRLEKVQEQYPNASNPAFSFLYSSKKLPNTNSSAQDHWGYYNGVLNNTSLIPAYNYQGFTLSTNNREINSAYTDAAILKTVFSPLGGATDYEFEQNTCSGCTNGLAPGLRIKKVTTRDPFSGIAAVTNYDYTNPATGQSSGVLLYTPNYFTTLDVVDNTHGNNYTYNALQIQANPTSLGNFSGSPVIYEYVTVYNGNDPNKFGKTVNRFSVFTQPPHYFPYFPLDEKAWMAGSLLVQEMYKVENNVATLVKKIENTYQQGPTVFTCKGLNIKRNKIYFFAEPGANDFFISNYIADSKFNYLQVSKVYDYEQGSGTTHALSTQTYFYDRSNVHLFPTKMETQTSESGVIYRQEYKYPLDYTQSGVYAAMASLNITGVPVEQFTKKVVGGTPYVTGYSKVDFLEWTPSKVYPKNFYTTRIPANTTEATFNTNPASYLQLGSQINAIQAGVPLETQVIGQSPSASIYDSSIPAVTAVVESAGANQIAYSSFETRNFGNWNVNCGTQTVTRSVNLSLEKTFQSITVGTTQTVTYTYSNVNSGGASPILTFQKEGASPINRILSGSSGSSSISLDPGVWNVSLNYDYNILSASASFNFQYTFPTLPTTSTSGPKTGLRAMQLLSGNTISKTGLPNGTYVVTYYQKSGTVSLTVAGGATLVSSNTAPAEADGWAKVTAVITISSISQSVQLTGSGVYIDELRLHPQGSYMTSTCYDLFGNTVSTTDQNMKSQYFEYDDRRALKLVRDHEKQIVQHTEYKLGVN